MLLHLLLLAQLSRLIVKKGVRSQNDCSGFVGVNRLKISFFGSNWDIFVCRILIPFDYLTDHFGLLSSKSVDPVDKNNGQWICMNGLCHSMRTASQWCFDLNFHPKERMLCDQHFKFIQSQKHDECIYTHSHAHTTNTEQWIKRAPIRKQRPTTHQVKK